MRLGVASGNLSLDRLGVANARTVEMGVHAREILCSVNRSNKRLAAVPHG